VRVTNQMMASSSLAHINALRSRTAALMDQISSGERITRVSEDPAAGAAAMRVNSRFEVMKQWSTNLDDAKTWVRATESAVTDVSSLLTKAKDLAITASNDTLSPETRQQIAPQADQLLQDLLAALNDLEPNGALFGGFQTSGKPFSVDLTTGTVTYSGDSGDMQRDVGPGVTLVANMHGNRVDNWASGNNMLTTVWNLSQALKAGDGAAVRATMTNLETARQKTVSLRAEMGARDQRIEHLESKMADTLLQLENMLEQAQGVDMEKAIMDLTSAETTYRAALQVGARVMPPTLADFLR